MWSALRSDFKEFATSIASDTTAVVENIESKLVVQEDDVSTAVMDDGTEFQAESNSNSNVNADAYYGNSQADSSLVMDEDGMVLGGGSGGTGMISDAMDEAHRRQGLEDTYTFPLLKDEVNGVAIVGTKVKSVNGDEHEKNEPNNDVDEDKNTDGSGTKEADSETAENENDQVTDTPAPTEEGDAVETKDDAFPDFDDFDQEDEDEAEAENDSVSEDDEDEDDPAVIEFLNHFDIQSKTDEISTILSKHSDTVGCHFENIVPVQVTYEQFWQRYFFRCDPDRIQKEWDEEDERARLERKVLIDKGKKTVQNLFGGALKAIQGGRGSHEDDEDEEEAGESIYEKYQAEFQEKQRAMMGGGTDSGTDEEEEKEKSSGIGSSLGGLFRGARPPFVMNTVVDDDDDDDDDDNAEEYVEEEEEDEEEDCDDDDFGWGSDEDDEDLSEEEEGSGDQDDDASDVTDDASEEIVFESTSHFSTPNVDSGGHEKLKQELDATREERDQLQKTVEMQSEQMKATQVSGSSSTDVDEEKEQLKLQIFEKDSELAAMKASFEDHEDDDTHQATVESQQYATELERLQSLLVEKDSEVAALKDSLADNQEDATKDEAIERSTAEIERLQSLLAENDEKLNNLSEGMKNADALVEEEDARDRNLLEEALETISALQNEIEELKSGGEENMDALRSGLEQEVDNLRVDTESYKQMAEELEQANANDKTNLEQAAVTIQTLESELEKAREEKANADQRQEDSVKKDAESSDALRRELEDITSKFEEAANSIQTLKNELEVATAGSTSHTVALESELAAAKSENEDFSVMISSLQSDLETSKALTIQLKHDFAIEDDETSDALSNAFDQLRSLQSELKSEREEAAAHSNEATGLRQSLAKSKSEEATNESVLHEALDTINSLENDLGASKAEIRQLREDLVAAATSGGDEDSANALQHSMETVTTLQSELENFKASETALRKQVEATEFSLDEEVTTYKEKLNEMNLTMDDLRAELDTSKSESANALQDAIENVATLKSELEASKALEARNEAEVAQTSMKKELQKNEETSAATRQTIIDLQEKLEKSTSESVMLQERLDARETTDCMEETKIREELESTKLSMEKREIENERAMSNLEQSLVSLGQDLENSNSNAVMLQESLDTVDSSNKEKLAEKEHALSLALENADALQAEISSLSDVVAEKDKLLEKESLQSDDLENLRQELDTAVTEKSDALNQVTKLQESVISVGEKLKQQKFQFDEEIANVQREVASSISPTPTSSSLSSAVEVEQPSALTNVVEGSSDNEDVGWGDSDDAWSDDEDL